jgi:hypothetical protein
MSRAPDTRLSEELMRLNRTQRQQLVNVVSKRFLREAAGENTPTTGVAAADPPAEPTRYSVPEAPVGEVIKDARGTAAFEKTDAGWKSTIKVPLERILMLVKEPNRQVVGKLLQDAGEGEVITILTGFLADAEDANMDKGLRVKKVDGMFMDPVTVPDDKITVIADALKYKAPEIKSGTPKTPAKVVLGPDDRVFNNIIFKYTDDTLKVIVDLDKGGTAQLKRLLGTDEAVTKADEQIANAPTSGESKITLRYDPKMTGNILQRAVPKKMLTNILQRAVPKKLFKSAADMAAGLPTDLQFRYLPGKKLLVLDLTGIEQAQWEEIAQQLDVGKETKPSDDSIGITYADLRGMKAGQIVQQITIDNGQETPTPYGTKFYADFMTIAGKTADINGNTFKNAKGKVVPLKNNNLKDYNGKIFTDGSGSKVYVHDSTAFQVFSYEQFLDAARVDMGDKASLKDDANFDRASRTWKQKDGNPVTGSITYRITDPVEKI